MPVLSILLTIIGLAVFEIISSIDNAIINAEVLSTMDAKSRKWFLFYGLLFAVFVMRGLLPWAIVWATNPQLGPIGSLTATFSANSRVHDSIERSAPILLVGGGTFLLFLFFHWLFMEPKAFGLKGERFFKSQSVWFYAVVSVILSVIVWRSLHVNSFMAFSAVIGSTAFFITHGLKENAGKEEQSLTKSNRSALSKIIYLEVIDATFSIDGVLGAFAFTLAVPLILLGNGIGALVLRQITVGNIDRIKKYMYLENGAMYSVFFLGLIMLGDSFGLKIPEYIAPIVTLSSVLYFYWKSKSAFQNKK